MDVIWHRGVIRYLQKKGLAPKKIFAGMVATLGDDPPVLSTVKKSAAEFKKGRESLEDGQRLRHASLTLTQKNIDCIHQIVMDNKRLTVNHIVNVISISCKRVQNILHKELGMLKVLTQYVLQLL